MTEIKIGETERKCLRLLVEAFSEPEHCILFYRHFTKRANINLTQARRAVRSLARKGLAEYSTAWDCDDGKVMGSGYMATHAGINYCRSLLHEERDGAAR